MGIMDRDYMHERWKKEKEKADNEWIGANKPLNGEMEMGIPQRDTIKIKEAEERRAALERYKNRQRWETKQQKLQGIKKKPEKNSALMFSVILNIILLFIILRLM